MLQPGTPSLFLELNALAGAVVAVEARPDPMMVGSDEVVLSPLDEAGGRRLLNIFGSPDALRALAEAIAGALDLLEIAPEGPVDYVARIGEPRRE